MSEFGTEDSINYSSRDPYTSENIPDKVALQENSFSRSSEQMPDLTSSANIIFNKELSGSESCNWYLLKKLGDNNSNFSSSRLSLVGIIREKMSQDNVNIHVTLHGPRRNLHGFSTFFTAPKIFTYISDQFRPLKQL